MTHSGAGKKLIVYGSLRDSFYLGERRMLTVKSSEHVKFNTDQIVIKGTERVAIQEADGTGLAVIKSCRGRKGLTVLLGLIAQFLV